MTGMDLVAPNRRGLFIDGSWGPAQAGRTFKVLDPADESPLAELADAEI